MARAASKRAVNPDSRPTEIKRQFGCTADFVADNRAATICFFESHRIRAPAGRALHRSLA